MAFFCLVGVASGDASSNGKKRFLTQSHQKLLRGVGRTTGDGLAGKRSPEGESAGGAERAEAMDGRRERPATWCGQSQAWQRAGTTRNRPSPGANVRRLGVGDPEATFGPRRQFAPVATKAPARGWRACFSAPRWSSWSLPRPASSPERHRRRHSAEPSSSQPDGAPSRRVARRRSPPASSPTGRWHGCR